MFLSKIWFIIVALVAGVALTFALIAPRPAVQKLGVLEGQRLDRAQYAAEQMFKVDAHKWIDRVSKLGRDAIVSDSLDAASRGTGEWTVLHKTLQDRFRALIPDLSTGGIETLVAMDGKGRVVARVGDNDKEYGDYIGGAEVVADALRGYMSDDVWGTGGKLLRVAAAPVLSSLEAPQDGGHCAEAPAAEATVTIDAGERLLRQSIIQLVDSNRRARHCSQDSHQSEVSAWSGSRRRISIQRS